VNILTTTIGYLAGRLDVPVASDVPASRPTAFVTVSRDGGAVSAYQDRPRLTVQVWHKDRLQLEALADAVVGALIAMRDAVDGVSRVDCQKAYYPEQGAKLYPRYVVYCDVVCGN
jgi:hypothetical protein